MRRRKIANVWPVAVEAAELMEPFQWEKGGTSQPNQIDTKTQAGMREELADVVIYCMQLANVAQIDLAGAIADKLEINAQKYPVGESRERPDKYTELQS